jgi:lysine 2,3-aminomutase
MSGKIAHLKARVEPRLRVEPWQWQLQNALRNSETVNAELATFTSRRVPSSVLIDSVSHQRFSCKITPYMIAALKGALGKDIPGAWEAFLWSFAPSEGELAATHDRDDVDCIGEENPTANPVPAITNFYKNRVLFRVTTMCAAYCRYCFRRRMVGDGPGVWDQQSIDQGLAYISSKPEVREVILSGGDPLVLSDRRLAYVLDRIKAVPHINRIRFDTKAFTMMPQRITSTFVQMLREYQPCYVIGHFTHPYELTEEATGACSNLIDAGVPVYAHIPLLRRINDNERTLAQLFEDLVDRRVKPYYLIHFIPTKWTEHFRVSIARGLDLMRYVQSSCDGLAVPTYIVYLPDAGGKVPITPQYILEQTADGTLFQTFDGRRVLYPEPKNIRPRRTEGV